MLCSDKILRNTAPKLAELGWLALKGALKYYWFKNRPVISDQQSNGGSFFSFYYLFNISQTVLKSIPFRVMW